MSLGVLNCLEIRLVVSHYVAVRVLCLSCHIPILSLILQINSFLDFLPQEIVSNLLIFTQLAVKHSSHSLWGSCAVNVTLRRGQRPFRNILKRHWVNLMHQLHRLWLAINLNVNHISLFLLQIISILHLSLLLWLLHNHIREDILIGRPYVAHLWGMIVQICVEVWWFAIFRLVVVNVLFWVVDCCWFRSFSYLIQILWRVVVNI